MTGLLTLLVRAICLKKYRSTVPTAITPLSNIRKAVLFLDGLQPSAENDIRKFRDFLASYSVELSAYQANLDRTDINLFGFFKKKRKIPAGDEQLFVSILTPDSFAIKYAAITSPASFKIGRTRMKGEVYDILFSTPEDSQPTQSEALEAVIDILRKIK